MADIIQDGDIIVDKLFETPAARLESHLFAVTRWRSGMDSNPRCRQGFYGLDSARVWRASRPGKKHSCWREFVRPGFGSASVRFIRQGSTPMLGDVVDQTKASGSNPSA
jgi:hypothetical protein